MESFWCAEFGIPENYPGHQNSRCWYPYGTPVENFNFKACIHDESLPRISVFSDENNE